MLLLLLFTLVFKYSPWYCISVRGDSSCGRGVCCCSTVLVVVVYDMVAMVHGGGRIQGDDHLLGGGMKVEERAAPLHL